MNISGISGVATKTTYASFLLYSLFHSGVLGGEAANTKALIFNVKGEDLLFLDQPNAGSTDERPRALRAARAAGRAVRVRRALGAGAAQVATSGARHRQPAGGRARRTSGRSGTSSASGLLRFMFAEAGDERSQIADLVARVEAALAARGGGRPRLAGDGHAARRRRRADARAVVRRSSAS